MNFPPWESRGKVGELCEASAMEARRLADGGTTDDLMSLSHPPRTVNPDSARFA
jgi:hypothetical protein